MKTGILAVMAVLLLLILAACSGTPVESAEAGAPPPVTDPGGSLAGSAGAHGADSESICDGCNCPGARPNSVRLVQLRWLPRRSRWRRHGSEPA